MSTPRVDRSKTRWAWLCAMVAMALVAVAISRTTGPAAAISTPTTFTVVQNPAGPANVQPGDTVSYVINFTSGASPANFLTIGGDLGGGLAIAGFSGAQASTCSNPSGSQFSCVLNQLGANATIQPLTVNATVKNVSDGTVIDLPTSAFWVRDGGADTPYNVPSDDAGALTVQNEALAVSITDTQDPITAGTNTTYNVSITNNGSAATGIYDLSLALSVGSVVNVICPGALAGGGNGTGTATCPNNASIAPGGSTTMSVVAKSNSSPSGYNMVASLTFSAGILLSNGSTTSQSTTVNGVALTPAKLAFTAQPAGGSTGAAFATQPVVAIQDAGGATVTTDNSTQVTLSAVGPSTLSCAGGNAKTAVNGVASFAGCSVNVAGSYTLHAVSSPALTAADTNAFSVSASNNPQPTLSSISPASTAAGGSGFTLTVIGTGFVNGVTTVQWGGSNRDTSCSGATSCTAAILDSDIANPGNADVRVVNGTPGGGTSAAKQFAVNNSVPTVTNVDPAVAVAGSPDTTITVTGGNFVSGSKVRWNGADLATSFVSGTSLQATVPAAKLTTVGTATVTVFNPTPGGGTSAQQIQFTINTGATKLAFTTQPGGAAKDTAFATQPVVAVQNANGDTVIADNTTKVKLALVGSGTLSCTGGLEKAVSKGVVTFAGCKVDTAGSGYSIVASAASLTSATSEVFEVTGPSQTSAQVVVAAPAQGMSVPRSRLTFSATTGALSPAPTAVSFVIERKSDGQYWNGETGAWQTAAYENAGTAPASSGGAWTYAVAGEGRRLFANTMVTVEARATTGAGKWSSAVVPEIAIR